MKTDFFHSTASHNTFTEEVKFWIAAQRERSAFELHRIPFANSREWSFENGILKHRTGRFFTIEGLRGESNFPHLTRFEQPIINQPEKGILGFLAQQRDGALHFLVQAKTEPGNVNVVQLAPSFQATISNYSGAHCGKTTPFREFFLERSRGRVIFDRLQSEQGSRFLRKSNRNMIVLLPPDEQVEHDETYRWLPVRDFCRLLLLDNVVNTDSRSVLISAPWDFLTDGCCPFSTTTNLFTNELQHSFKSFSPTSFKHTLHWIEELQRVYQLKTERLPLSAMAGWVMEQDRIYSEGDAGFEIIHVAVTARDREVQNWDQPLMTNNYCGLNAMLCQRQNDVMKFLLQATVEPGTRNVVELTTSVHGRRDGTLSDQQAFLPLADPPVGTLIWEATHSEEGGRFFQDQNLYRLIELSETVRLELPANYRWVSLGEIAALLEFENLLTNEARSLLAMLTFSMWGNGDV